MADVDKIWPFIPETGAIERLLFSTDVQLTREREQRAQMRQAPSLEIEYQCKLNDIQTAQAINFASVGTGSTIRVPIWFESFGTGQHDAGSVFIGNTKAFESDYYALGGDVLIWVDYQTFFETTIGAIDPSFITINDPLPFEIKSAQVVPVVDARFMDDMSIQRIGYNWNSASISFACDVAHVPTNADFFDDYQGHKVFHLRNLLQSNTETYGVDYRTMYPGLGPVDYLNVGRFTRRTSVLNCRGAQGCAGGPSEYDLRRFLHWTAGQLRPFWVPRWENSIVVGSDIPNGAGSMVIQDVASELRPDHGAVYIETIDGARHYAIYTSGGSGGTNTLILDVPFSTYIHQEDIVTACFMDLWRFADDAIEMRHDTRKFNQRFSVQMPMIGVPFVYEAP